MRFLFILLVFVLGCSVVSTKKETSQRLQCSSSCRGAANCKQVLQLPENGFTYYASHDLSSKNECIDRAVILVHGADRHGNGAYDTLTRAIDLESQKHTTLAIAPDYKISYDTVDPMELTWTPYGWKVGHLSDNYSEGERYPSYHMIDLFLQKLVNKQNFPNLRTVVIAGHSAGGQFTQRYAFSSSFNVYPPIRIKYVPMNAGTFMYLNGYRLNEKGKFEYPRVLEDGELALKHNFRNIANGDCPWGYNEYKFGIEDANTQVSQNPIDKLRETYLNRSVIYLVGDQDTNTSSSYFEKTCSAMLQGETRYKRALNFFAHLNTFYRHQHSLFVVPGIGHSLSGMILSPVGRKIILQD